MDILPSIRIIDLGLYLEKYKTIIFNDLHMGYEDALRSKGVLLPKFALKDTIKRLESISEKAGPIDRVVINGDLKHEFGRINRQEWSDTLKLIDFILTKSKTISIIKGNHDPSLGPVAEKRGIHILPCLILDGILIIHGDELPKAIAPNIKTIIIGHEHAAIRLRDGSRNELFKCFLLGSFQKKNLIVCPSFHLLHEGTDVLSGNHLSPFLDADMSAWKVWIVADDFYSFGTLGKLGLHDVHTRW